MAKGIDLLWKKIKPWLTIKVWKHEIVTQKELYILTAVAVITFAVTIYFELFEILVDLLLRPEFEAWELDELLFIPAVLFVVFYFIVLRRNRELKLQIREREKVEKQLSESLAIKEALLKEIHHRVKNNLQLVSSILQMQSGCLGNETVTAVFGDCEQRIKSMALIHDKLYKSPDLTNIDFKDYIEILIKDLVTAYKQDEKNISLKLNIENIDFDLDTAIPLGLIINELITNSLKHAFANGKEGEIRVALCSAENNGYELKVRDTGIGLPDNIDINNPQSLGLRVTTIFAKQLRGNIQIKRNQGTEIQIAFQRAIPTKRA